MSTHESCVKVTVDQAGEIARLKAALAPFAAVADEYAEQEDDAHEVWIDAGPVKLIRASFRLGLYRAARAALQPAK